MNTWSSSGPGWDYGVNAVSGFLVLPGSRKPLIEISYMVCREYDFFTQFNFKDFGILSESACRNSQVGHILLLCSLPSGCSIVGRRAPGKPLLMI